MEEKEEVKTNFDLIVAIDFGTDGTALAYSKPNTNEVYLQQDWNEKDKHNKENLGAKMKTNILLKRLKNRFKNKKVTKEYKFDNYSSSGEYIYEFVAFGEEATNKYQNKNIYIDQGSQNWVYFEQFKMALFS